MGLSNRQIAKALKLGGKLLELHGENEFKIRSYENAAKSILAQQGPIAEYDEKQLETIKGVGKNIAKKIVQLNETGTYEEFESLVQQTPPGLIELISIKGISAGKARSLWQQAGIASPEDLLQACLDNQLAALKGFGEKSQENIAELLEYYFEGKGKYLYGQAYAEIEPLLAAINDLEGITRAECTGDYRRKSDIIIQVDILIESGDREKAREAIDNSGMLEKDPASGEYTSAEMGIPLNLFYVDKQSFVKEWLLTTGSPEHIAALNINVISNPESERRIYEANGKPFVPAEMREGRDEFEVMTIIKEEDLITYKDLRGCLHNHSNYSDGGNTIETMARQCMEMGYEYFGISDHSKSATYASGMQPKKVLEQMKEIDALNIKLAPFQIFKGIESDILNDGSLDYEEDILTLFDFVVASIHSNLKMTEADATIRLINAIENPYTTILGHSTGRLLLMRRGYSLDHKKVIDACAANGVSIELNAAPRRLDMDWRWLQYAMSKNIMIAINPDAHEVTEISNMYFGVCCARKGGLTKTMTLNALGRKEIEEYFNTKKQQVLSAHLPA